MSEKRAVALVVFLMAALAAWGTFYFRATYSHAKRLKVVEPGRFYRSGQLTADGFADAVRRFGIRTVINVQEDYPDPDVWHNYTDRSTVKESEVCKRLGVRYVWMSCDLVHQSQVDHARPLVIDQLLELLDRDDVYPVLVHCKAGLHRTGLLSAIYRMEYQGWSRLAAFRELRAHGFGDWVSTSANIYVDQYLMRYQPRPRRTGLAARGRAD